MLPATTVAKRYTIRGTALSHEGSRETTTRQLRGSGEDAKELDPGRDGRCGGRGFGAEQYRETRAVCLG